MFPLFFSMNETVLTSVRDWLEGHFEEAEGFGDCYVVDLSLSGAKLSVFVDSDTGITLDQCRRLSRFLEERIEAEAMLPEKYTLEVSSPGVDRPLGMLRQYVKNIGRELRVVLLAEEEGGKGETVKGKLEAVEGEMITLSYTEVQREGKKKKKVMVKREIPFSRIEKSNVLISFK